MKQPKIVIVGAGPSGIAAASKLFENGFTNVTILEAENRIGGRVCTGKIGDYFVDLGAEWVHGEKGNVVYEMVAPYGFIERTGKHHYEKTQEFVDSLGNTLNEESKKYLADFYYKYVEEAEPMTNIDSKSQGGYLEKMFDKEFINNPKMYNEKKKFLNHLELYVLAMESAETWHDVKIENDGFVGFPGDQMICWKSRGYSTILDIIMKRIPDHENELPVVRNVVLNSEVKLIDYSKKENVIVSTEKNKIYKADHVIVTIPLGVLKAKHSSMFTPALPADKVKTIESLGFGSIVKIFLLFEKPFWNLESKKGLQISFIWNEKDRMSVEKDPEKNWVLGMLGIMSVEYRPNLLIILVTGSHARAMESLADDIILLHVRETLHRFLDKKFNVTEPVDMLRTRWFTNPHFRGTFTYGSLKTQKERVDAENLQRPINSDNLSILFAGEATSKDRFSTVDGAIVSGWKAANKLIEHYNK